MSEKRDKLIIIVSSIMLFFLYAYYSGLDLKIQAEEVQKLVGERQEGVVETNDFQLPDLDENLACEPYSKSFTSWDDNTAVRYSLCEGLVNNESYVVLCNKATCRTIFNPERTGQWPRKGPSQYEHSSDIWVNKLNKKTLKLFFWYKGDLQMVALVEEDANQATPGWDVTQEVKQAYAEDWVFTEMVFALADKTTAVAVQFESYSDNEEDQVKFWLSGVDVKLS